MLRYIGSRKPRLSLGLILAAILCCVVVVRPAYGADNPAEGKKAAESAMLAWLGEIDAGAYAKSWDDASSFFRKAVTSEGWQQQINAVRGPLGRCSSRVIASARYSENTPGLHGVASVMVQFKSSFDGLAYAVETVTFVKDGADGWRSAGYYIKPGP